MCLFFRLFACFSYSHVTFFRRLGNLCLCLACLIRVLVFDQIVGVWSDYWCLIRLFVFDQSISVWPVWSLCLCLMRGASPPLFQLSPPAVVGQWVSRSQLGNTWPLPFLVCCVCVCVFVFVFVFVLIHFMWKAIEAVHAGNISPCYFFPPCSLHWYLNTHINISEG